MIFEPLTINGVTFKNRILRSSMGGRSARYDGTITSVWKNFEKRFALGGVGGIISTTLNVNRHRKSPLEYPPISEDKYVPALSRAVKEVQSTGCRYLIQIGDPGSATQTGLFPEEEDSHSSSTGLDMIYGYGGRHVSLTEEGIRLAIKDFGDAARRVRDTGADGLEVTASKGYLIHQFLNPAVNRRKDDWGGDHERRFRFLGEVVKEIRAQVGRDFLFGIRLAAEDYNYLPLNLRWPPVWPPRHFFMGNRLAETLDIARRLEQLGVDFLHIDSGYGFIHPRVTPGPFPFDEIRIFFDQVRHLSWKAALRAGFVHVVPATIGRRLFNLGWRYQEGINLDYARTFKEKVGIAVIANGGFQHRSFIDKALTDGACDLVSMARALLANPDLVQQFEGGKELPELPCTYCNRCAARTATSPLGCYEQSRFPSVEAMQDQILAWNRGDA
jgi:2,4-dienoyl-CoA reductase (NADPH2)